MTTPSFGGLRSGLIAPLPGERARFVFAVPVPGEQRVYAGLTDEPADGPLPEVPEPTPGEIAFLLDTVSGLLEVPLSGSDVLGAFAGLRPPIRGPPGGGAGPGAPTADLSRRHAVLTSPDGVITVVGGKLTTYRRIARDAVDAALAAFDARDGRGSGPPGRTGRTAGPCRTARLTLVGAADPRTLAGSARRPGWWPGTARRHLQCSAWPPQIAAGRAGGRPMRVTGAELAFAVRHEGALDDGDLLDRRTRIGLVPDDRRAALAAAARALAQG